MSSRIWMSSAKRARPTFLQRKRTLRPPFRLSGRRFELCCMLSRCVFSLSWQETSAGRNLITLFLTVNNPGDFFFGRQPGAPPSASARATRSNARAHRRVRDARDSTSLKPKRGAGFRASRFFFLVFPTMRARVRERVEGVRGDLYRKKKFLSATAPDFASHKPDCAKVRELFLPSNAVGRASRALVAGRRRRRSDDANASANARIAAARARTALGTQANTRAIRPFVSRLGRGECATRRPQRALRRGRTRARSTTRASTPRRARRRRRCRNAVVARASQRRGQAADAARTATRKCRRPSLVGDGARAIVRAHALKRTPRRRRPSRSRRRRRPRAIGAPGTRNARRNIAGDACAHDGDDPARRENRAASEPRALARRWRFPEKIYRCDARHPNRAVARAQAAIALPRARRDRKRAGRVGGSHRAGPLRASAAVRAWVSRWPHPRTGSGAPIRSACARPVAAAARDHAARRIHARWRMPPRIRIPRTRTRRGRRRALRRCARVGRSIRRSTRPPRSRVCAASTRRLGGRGNRIAASGNGDRARAWPARNETGSASGAASRGPVQRSPSAVAVAGRGGWISGRLLRAARRSRPAPATR